MIIQETTKMSEREKMAARNSNFCYLLNALYPVGSIYVSKDPTDPAELFGGSWKRIKERFIWAIGDNENPGDTGGEKTHTLTEAELPEITGSFQNIAMQGIDRAIDCDGVFSNSKTGAYATFGTNGSYTKTDVGDDIVHFSAGGGEAHNNMPPWEGFYIWERIESDVPMGGSAGMLLADQTYNPESANAQSGIAVAQAVDTCSPAIVTASDTGKALSIPDSSESVIKGLIAYGESSQDGTPMPDSPVEIVSVENPVISVYGKNLSILPHSMTGTSSTSVYAAGLYQKSPLKLFPGVQYTLSFDLSIDQPTGYRVRVYQGSEKFADNNNIINQDKDTTYQYISSSGTVHHTVTVTTIQTLPLTSLDLGIVVNVPTGDTSKTVTVTDFQIEIGSTATAYEPYTEPQTVTLPYTFRGLKNTSGDWVARDELRVGNGKVEIVRNCYSFLVDETLSNLFGLSNTANVMGYVVTTENKPQIPAMRSQSRVCGMCSRFRVEAKYWAGQIEDQAIVFGGNNQAIYLLNLIQELPTKDDFIQYCTANPFEIIYWRDTPEIEDITATEAGQELLALKTNYPTTSVISDIDLNITYKADTKNYIDNKIAERLSAIETAILNNI